MYAGTCERLRLFDCGMRVDAPGRSGAVEGEVGAPAIAGGVGLAIAGSPFLKYEDFLVEKLGGKGAFKEGGREFDGAFVDKVTGRDTWYEAKSGGFWQSTAKNPDRLREFFSTEGQKTRISRDRGVDFKVISENQIPEEFTSWFDAKGIPWEVMSND